MFCRQFIFLLLILFFCGSCANKPKEVLSMSKMTDILVDLNKAEALFESERYRNEISQEEQYRYRLGILEKHNSNQAQLDSSIVWYNRDPKKLDKIFFRVLGELQDQKEYIVANPIRKSMLADSEGDSRDFVSFKRYLMQVSSPEEFNFDPHRYSIEFSSDSLLRRYKSSSTLYYKIKEKEYRENRAWLKSEFERIYSSNALDYDLLSFSPLEFSIVLLQGYAVQPLVLEEPTDDPVLKSLNTPKPIMLP